MKIEFLCPNGHQLSAGVELVGKPGKCPKCGSKFVVPDPGEDEDEPGATQPTPTRRTETIDFLCPNGHRLNGPASLQGKPGQCPHCGQKFRIPSYEDEEAEEEAEEKPAAALGPPMRPGSAPSAAPTELEDDIPVGSVVDDGPAPLSASASGVIDLSGGKMAEIVADDLIGADDDAIEVKGADIIEDSDADMLPPSASKSTMPSLNVQHPVAKAFLRLWSRRESDSEVELHLREGGTVTAARFAPSLSQNDFGVFASPDGDNRFCVTMVAWDSISRIGFRKMKELPESLFE